MSKLAPIVLFVYNRPEHTLRTLEALVADELSKDSTLYIFADGVNKEATTEDHIRVQEVEKIVSSRSWCSQVILRKRERNYGLADNIVSGVSEVINVFGKIIVLEDDVVVSRGFLKFMNDALDLYDTEERVMHISAYTVPTTVSLPDTFFITQSHCWGWATWRRAWSRYNDDTVSLLKALNKSGNYERFNAGSDYYSQLLLNHRGAKKTWAVKWYASIFLSNGLALHSAYSLVDNIGMDGTGENSQKTDEFKSILRNGDLTLRRIPIEENVLASAAVRQFESRRRSKPQGRQISRLWKRILLGLVASVRDIQIKIHRLRISESKNIYLHPSVRVTISSLIEIRYGGEIRIGKKTEVLDNVCILSYGGGIIIGEYCSINSGAIIYGHGGTFIGNNVLIAGHCMIIPNTHNFDRVDIPISNQGHTSKGIFIDDDVWIGHGCTILDDVTIGKGAIIAAGSVVRESVPPYSIYAGVPARFIKSRSHD